MGLTKKLWIAVGVAFFIGVFSLFFFRFFTAQNSSVHYHANFALYVNGTRDEFKSFTFYEEVAACSAAGSSDPKTRVHMHDNINDVVHVHDEAATWGAFFANLGYTLGDHLVQTEDGLYVDGQDGKKLTFILNGEAVQTVANRVIGNTDVLLISYGSESEADLQQRYIRIPHTAAEVNAKSDPATCSGSAKLTIPDRAKSAIGL